MPVGTKSRTLRPQVLRCQFVTDADGEPVTRLLLGSETKVPLQQSSLPTNGGPVLQSAGDTVAVVPGTPLHQQWEDFVYEPFDLFQSRLLRMKVNMSAVALQCVLLACSEMLDHMHAHVLRGIDIPWV